MEKLIQGLIYSLLATTGLASGLVAAKPGSRLSLAEFTVQTPFEITHPILAADLLPGAGKELITLGADDNHRRWMAIYQLENNQYRLAHKLALPRELYSFDVSEYRRGQYQQLYFLSQDRLHIFSLQNESGHPELTPIAEINSLAIKDRPDFISRGEFVTDLNGDKRDDIIIADFTRVHLFLAGAQGFERQTLPITPQSRLFEGGASYTQSKLYVSDINLDGRQDIVKIGEGELEVYKQTPQQMFEPVAEFVSVRQPISGIDWWNKRDAYGEALDQSKLVYRKVEELRDINNDGITDLVVRYTKSSGVFDRSNDYEVYLGEAKEGKLTFPKAPNSVVRAEGTLTGLEFVDIDSDDRAEVLVAGFDIGISQIIGALLAGSIDQDVHLFKMDARGQFSQQSNVSKEVELNFSLSSGQNGNPVVKLADVNGDGLKDLLLSDDEQTLKIYFGVEGEQLFSQGGEKHRLLLPQDGDMVHSEDLNGDGKDDLLIKYGRQDDPKLLSQFRVFLAS